jgi:hypothetical protein
LSKLTQASKGQPCIRCGAPGAWSCHYAGPRQHSYGKGRGIKCSDLATAEFCQKCDQVFSEGKMDGFTDKWDKSEQWLHYIMLTNIRRIERGVICL